MVTLNITESEAGLLLGSLKQRIRQVERLLDSKYERPFYFDQGAEIDLLEDRLGRLKNLVTKLTEAWKGTE